METLQEVYNRYEYFLNGIGFTETYYEFQMEMGSIYTNSEIQAYGIDLNYLGKDFAIYLKSIFQKINKDYYKAVQHEAKLFPNEDFFCKKNIKKLNEIKSMFQEKHPGWDFISKDIEDVLEDLEVAFNIQTSFYKSDERKMGVLEKRNKIKWLGKTNVLVTLFYDLLHGQDRKTPYIEATQEDIESFLMNNFLDADGKELSSETVNTYIRPDRPEKRAKLGDRIELGNVKLKNRKES